MKDYEAKGYKISEKHTGRIMFKCLDCNEYMIYMSNRSDGRTCYKCNGYITPIGYAVKEESNEFK